ncbi:CsgG/HfaB family protein [Sphingomonas sp.]|uniref:CsgG/HfaB family protein n=1 Tax=Sphingomonas sp. TaxID=28214 RepID=UPI001B2A1273|nr:CsgG/HfaB family protein [Sphingomonas sp.]MBO9712440.1 transcriptional regulator [Sphingomonas sp.]
MDISFPDLGRTAAALAIAASLGACTGFPARETAAGIRTASQFPVTSNETPYSACLRALAAAPGVNLPAIAVGEVADKTGQFSVQDHGYALSQGATEMVISAFHKTGKVRLVERADLRVANQELTFRKNTLVSDPLKPGALRQIDFYVVGALTELNYNILSQGAGLWIKGIGGGAKAAVVNVALDLRMVNARTLEVAHVVTLQKQIVGREVEANVFRFFSGTLVELDAGKIRNEPLQLGVRSVAEMAVHEIMTDYLGLPPSEGCRRTDGGAAAPNSK